MSQSKDAQIGCCTAATLLQAVPAVVACVLWSVASSSIILLNKHLLSVHQFQAPMVLCSLGMIFSRAQCKCTVSFSYKGRNIRNSA
eukprot:1185869-Prorocentrum_minimum.AAC.4